MKKKLFELFCGITKRKKINDRWLTLSKQSTKAFKPFVRNEFDSIEINAIKKYCKPGYIIFDIGANIGVMTVEMSEIAGSNGKVFSFEPNPFIFRELIDLINTNCHFDNVVPIQSAIAEAFNVEDFFVSKTDSLGVMSSLYPNDSQSFKTKVSILTIDIISKGLTQLDYIKIDAEGAEELILRGGIETLAKFKPVIQIEIHGNYLSNFKSSVQGIFEILENLGYTALNLITQEKTDFNDFMRNTHFHYIDPRTNKDLAFEGYGQVVFLPEHIGNA